MEMPALTDCGGVCENVAKELGYRMGELLSRLIVLDKGIACYSILELLKFAPDHEAVELGVLPQNG